MVQRNFDFIDQNNSERFYKNKDEYLNNIKIISFDEIYCSIGFKPYNNSLKHFRPLTPEEICGFKPLKHYRIVHSKKIEKIPPKKTWVCCCLFRMSKIEYFCNKGRCARTF